MEVTIVVDSSYRGLAEAASDVWGADRVYRKLAEECGELLVEASHYQEGRGDRVAVAEEIADVHMVLCHLTHQLRIEEQVAAYIPSKVRRWKERIEAQRKAGEGE